MTYEYTVTGVNAIGEGEPSNTVTVALPSDAASAAEPTTTPPAPQNLTASLTSDSEGIVLGWDAPDESVFGYTDAVVAKPNSPVTGAPTISGTAQVGETLTADTSGIADEDGLDNAAFSYQWLAGDSDISGATGRTYTLAERYPQKVCKQSGGVPSLLKQHGLKAQERRYTAYGKEKHWELVGVKAGVGTSWRTGFEVRVQELIQELLEEEVTEFLGRAKSARRSESDNETGYRNGYGRPPKAYAEFGNGTAEEATSRQHRRGGSRAGCCRCSSTGPGRLLS